MTETKLIFSDIVFQIISYTLILIPCWNVWLWSLGNGDTISQYVLNFYKEIQQIISWLTTMVSYIEQQKTTNAAIKKIHKWMSNKNKII